jgi:hypothetical protein
VQRLVRDPPDPSRRDQPVDPRLDQRPERGDEPVDHVPDPRAVDRALLDQDPQQRRMRRRQDQLTDDGLPQRFEIVTLGVVGDPLPRLLDRGQRVVDRGEPQPLLGVEPGRQQGMTDPELPAQLADRRPVVALLREGLEGTGQQAADVELLAGPRPAASSCLHHHTAPLAIGLAETGRPAHAGNK